MTVAEPRAGARGVDSPERRRGDRGSQARGHRGGIRRASGDGLTKWAADGPGAAIVHRALHEARPAPDRRGQAVLALGGADRERGAGHRRAGPGVRSRRGRGDLGAVRAPLVRRVGRRRSARPRRRQHPGAGEGIRRRSEAVRDAPRRRCRCGAPPGRPAPEQAATSRARLAGDRARAWSRSSRPTIGGSSSWRSSPALA